MSILTERAAERFYKYGEAVLVFGALLSGSYAVASKIATRYESVKKIPDIDARLTHVEHKTEFLVHGMERLTHTRYARTQGE